MEDAQSVFVVLDEDRVLATPIAGGPWSPAHMHGGAPSALIAWAADCIASAVPMRISRVTVEMLRPAPVGEITIDRRVVREGRTTQTCEIRLIANGVEVTRATVLKLAPGPFEEDLEAKLPATIGGEQGWSAFPSRKASHIPFNRAFDIRDTLGAARVPGQGRMWFRQTLPLLAGRQAPAAARAVAVADFTNGIASLVDISAWTFLSCDLSVHLARDPEGEWIFSTAHSWVSADGIGIATTILSDERGAFGQATQTTQVRRRPVHHVRTNRN